MTISGDHLRWDSRKICGASVGPPEASGAHTRRSKLQNLLVPTSDPPESGGLRAGFHGGPGPGPSLSAFSKWGVPGGGPGPTGLHFVVDRPGGLDPHPDPHFENTDKEGVQVLDLHGNLPSRWQFDAVYSTRTKGPAVSEQHLILEDYLEMYLEGRFPT